jgi:hypothetical protein
MPEVAKTWETPENSYFPGFPRHEDRLSPRLLVARRTHAVRQGCRLAGAPTGALAFIATQARTL